MTFSGHTLLPHLKVLQHQLLKGSEEDDEKFRSSYFDLELLPYALGGAWQALSEFTRLQREIVEKYPDEKLTGLFFGLSTDERDLLSYMVDNFFEVARRAQNGAIHYLARGLRISLPSSMSELVKKMRAGKLKIPDLPHARTLEYWEEFGGKLKDYRDLAQHHALVTSDARLVKGVDGRVGVYLLLPSNPEVKSAGKLIFGAPSVHALPFIRRQFKALVLFLGWLTRGLISLPPEERRQAVTHVFRDPAVLGDGVTYEAVVPPSAEGLKEWMDTFLVKARELGG